MLATNRITSFSAKGCSATKASTSRMICTEMTPTRCFHASFQIAWHWYADTYSCRIWGVMGCRQARWV